MIVKILLIIGVASLSQALNYVNTPIAGAKCGLHYEVMGNVRFTTAEWKYATYIDMVRLAAQRPIVTNTILEKVNQTCQYHESAEVCTILLRGRELLEKSRLVEALFEQLQNSPVDDGKEEIKAQLHHIHDELDKMRNQTLLADEDLDKAFDVMSSVHTRATYYLMIDRLQRWVHQLQVEFDYYIDFLQIVMEANQGIIHPGLFNFQELETAVSQFLEANESVFPLSIEDMRAGQLEKISTVNIVYLSEKLIVTLNIPLLDRSIYELYKVYSYPVPQSDEWGSAYIQLRADLVLFSRNYYTLAHTEDIAECMFLSGSYICRPIGPLYDTTLQPACEAAVIMKKKQPFTDCIVKITPTSKPSWTKTTQGWLYSLPEEEAVYIVCDGSWVDMVNVSGVGVLQLKSGCQAQTAYGVMAGHQNIMNISMEQTSSENLNVSALVSAAEPPRDLEDVRREIEQTDYHTQEYERQICIYVILLIGQFLLGNLFLYFFHTVYSGKYVVGYRDVAV